MLLQVLDSTGPRGLSILLRQRENVSDLLCAQLAEDDLLIRRRLQAVQNFVGLFAGCRLFRSGQSRLRYTRTIRELAELTEPRGSLLAGQVNSLARLLQ